MKKAIIILFTALLIASAIKAQLFVTAGVGVSVSQASPVAEANMGYKIPFDDCAPRPFYEGLMATAGFIKLTDENLGVFNIKAGKSFLITDYSELQILAGYANFKESNDDTKGNTYGSIVTVNYVHSFQYDAAWNISVSSGKNFFSGTIGLRYLFVK